MIQQVLPAASFQHSHLCPGAKENLFEIPYIQQDQKKFKTKKKEYLQHGLEV
jgi:hypothetical protein